MARPSGVPIIGLDAGDVPEVPRGGLGEKWRQVVDEVRIGEESAAGDSLTMPERGSSGTNAKHLVRSKLAVSSFNIKVALAVFRISRTRGRRLWASGVNSFCFGL